ncbi:MBLAC2 [Symbiodinium pilosum]|uniref:MBLAC2 protein n=1 Tax=Symbiodinium pilosum TaxID=2952 RepID=A0A812W1Z7_SYMPI|nr:MBLAC2 [Symbiodinium pilosum]
MQESVTRRVTVTRNRDPVVADFMGFPDFGRLQLASAGPHAAMVDRWEDMLGNLCGAGTQKYSHALDLSFFSLKGPLGFGETLIVSQHVMTLHSRATKHAKGTVLTLSRVQDMIGMLLGQVTVLHIEMHDDNRECSVSLAAHLPEKRSLVQVVANGVSDAGLKVFGENLPKQLTSLHVDFGQNLTDAGVKALTEALPKQLTSLHVDLSWKRLKAFGENLPKQLTSLHVDFRDNMNFTDAGLKGFGETAGARLCRMNCGDEGGNFTDSGMNASEEILPQQHKTKDIQQRIHRCWLAMVDFKKDCNMHHYTEEREGHMAKLQLDDLVPTPAAELPNGNGHVFGKHGFNWLVVVEADRFGGEQPHMYVILGPKKAVVIDTGCDTANFCDFLSSLRELEGKEFQVNTHIHYDHIMGNYGFCAPGGRGLRRGCRSLLAWSRNQRFSQNWQETSLQGMVGADISNFCVTDWLEEGQRIYLDDENPTDAESLEVLFTPGHTPDSISLYYPAENRIFTGDLIYPGNIFLFLPGSKLEEFQESLHKLHGFLGTKPAGVLLGCGHITPSLKAEKLDELHELLSALRQGEAKGRQTRSPYCSEPVTSFQTPCFTLMCRSADVPAAT